MERLYVIPRRKTNEVQEEIENNDIKEIKPKSISKRFLVNKLNYINFQDRTILVNMEHKKYGSILSLSAKPLPCSGERLDCEWSETADPWIIKSHVFKNIFVTDGKKCLQADAEQISIDGNGISFLLPETCFESYSRKTKRQTCVGVQAHFVQSSALYKGVLLDCSPTSFRVHVTGPTAQSFQWINSTTTVNLQLHAGDEFLYSGECKIIRQTFSHNSGIFVLSPIHDRIQRYKPKHYRSARYSLLPAPNALFVHPFTGITCNLKTFDLSGSGFSVEESSSNSMLFAGLIIPDLELSFAQSFKIRCRVQVVYRNTINVGEKDGMVRCGIAMLDMAMDDHVRLLSLLHQVDNKNSYVCTNVDMDTLWNFFFETGFIYPEKYEFFQNNKKEVKRVYELLYNHNPSVARHFIYQDKGTILGHLSMVRVYENSWMIHHHAASKTESMKAGIVVLKQISCYMNDLNHLKSAHLDYVLGYYRPDNKFPTRFFGGCAKHLNDKSRCSQDNFAYYHFMSRPEPDFKLPEPWIFGKAKPEELAELKTFYEHSSGGLLIEAFELVNPEQITGGLRDEYKQLGLKKEKFIYSLNLEGELKAVFIVNVSDIGFNMTNLTNCTSVIVLDNYMPYNIIEAALNNISELYENREMPILLYPVEYADNNHINYERIYTLWILNMAFTDEYFNFCASIFSMMQKSLTADAIS